MSDTLPRRQSSSSSLAAVCACLLILVALIDSQVVAAITPQIAAGLGAGMTSVAASVTFYSLAAASVALLLGRSGRRVRARVWLPAAAAMFVGANLLAAAAPHLSIFWAARALAGLAGGLISALAIAALADASAYARRGRQMSGVAISYFLAPVLGVPLGAFVAGRVGWRAVFIGAAVLVALAGLLVRLFPLPGVPEDSGKGTNERAAGETQESGDEKIQGSGTGSLWRLATRNRSTLMGIASAFFVSGGLVGLTTYLGAWLADAFRAGAREVGTLYAVAGFGAVLGGALGGVLADKY
ncbi:MAG: MFS transporter, partial [Pyrinomonadaceae bacterium]